MTYDEALHVAKVVCLFDTGIACGKDRHSIRERSKKLHPMASTGIEMATAEYIMTKANGVDRSFLR